MIELVRHAKKAPGARYDPKKGWISYRIDCRVAGRRYRQGGFSTKREAQDFIDRLRTARRDNRAGLVSTALSPRLSELFAKRLSIIPNPKEKIRAKRIFRMFVDLTGDIYATDVKRGHFQAYINSRDGVKPATISREITILSACFHTARDLFPQLDGFVFPEIPRPKYTPEPSKKRIITNKEKDAIVEQILIPRDGERMERTAAREPFARMFELCWLLGLRFGEALYLKRRDLKGRSLRVHRLKTGTIDVLDYLPDRAVELLTSDTDPIFDIKCSDVLLNRLLKQACEAIGIEYGREALDGVTFHRTRHSFISRLVKVTDLATAREYAGHSNAVMTAHYSHASDESKRRAMQKLYGGDNLRDIFDKVRNKDMSFEDFKDAIDAQNS